MAAEGTRVLIVHPVDTTRKELAEALRRVLDGPLGLHEAGSVTEGLRTARWLDPQYVLLDLTEERELALEVAREIRRADRLVVGLYNPLLIGGREGEFHRAAARAGVGDFVPLPAAEAELAAALAAAPGGASSDATGRTIAFFSHRGGTGVTTLAVNTALVLAGAGEAGEVALCDADLQFGDAAAMLGMAPDRDLADMVRDLDELEALSTYLGRHQETGLRLLARPQELADAEAVSPQAMSRLLIRLERRFDHVVLDMPPTLDLLTLGLLDLADKIFLVTEAVTPTLLGTARLLRLLDEQGFAPERLRLVVNRFEAFEGNLSTATVVEQLGRPIDYLVPYDRELVVHANRGLPAVLGRQKGALPDLVGQMADDAIRPPLARATGPLAAR